MSIFARQFGRPRGLLGRLVGRGMARGNAEPDFFELFVEACQFKPMVAAYGRPSRPSATDRED